MKITLLMVCVFGLISAQNKTIQIEKNELIWTGKAAYSNYSLSGTLNIKKGSITLIKDSITTMDISIAMKSLDHKNNTLKEHLKSDDFFDVSTFPLAKFKLHTPVKLKEGSFTIKGLITIKNKEHLEIIEVNYNSTTKTLSFNATLDRTKYGIIFNSPNFFKKLKNNAIADSFKITGAFTLN